MTPASDRAREQDRARKRSYGRACVDCGKLTTGSNGRAAAPLRCASCFNKTRTIWTRDEIVAAMRRFAVRYGRQPSASDWNTSYLRAHGHDDLAQRFYTDGDYPAAGTVRNVFGSWSAGIRAAGFEPSRVGRRAHG